MRVKPFSTLSSACPQTAGLVLASLLSLALTQCTLPAIQRVGEDVPTPDVEQDAQLISDSPTIEDVVSCDANTNSDPNNCGECMRVCVTPNATAACTVGRCAIAMCQAGFGDCNTGVVDGCESPLNTSANCGSCGHTCAPGMQCMNGHCPTDVKRVVGSAINTCSLTYGGSMNCWGSNIEFENGFAAGIASSTAQRFPNQPMDVSELVGSSGQTLCALHGSNRHVSCWGEYARFDGMGASPIPIEIVDRGSNMPIEGVTSVAFGGSHGCAVTANRQVSCWGVGFFGQLGDGLQGAGATRSAAAPAPIPGRMIVSVAAGTESSYALDDQGDVWSWGGNSALQLGDASVVAPNVRTVPARVTMLAQVTRIFAGERSACAVANNRLLCWGDNSSGQLGVGSVGVVANPQVFGSGEPAVDVHIGDSFLCAVLRDGTVRCSGANNVGQLGDRTTVNRMMPVSVPAITDAVSIGGGASHACVVRSNGATVCWGSDRFGQLGSARALILRQPSAVRNLVATPRSMAASTTTTCYTTGSSQLYCWGGNFAGETDAATQTPRTGPTRVLAQGVTVSLALAMEGASCAVTSLGTQCWGLNTQGMLGSNSADALSLAPMTVVGLNRPTILSARYLSACAVHATGMATTGLSCWGRNLEGQLDPTRVNLRGPVQLLADNVSDVAVGYYHSCATRSTGTICWGSELYGEFGDGTISANRSVATINAVRGGPVASNILFSDITAGEYFSCGVNQSGVTYCWGLNAENRLGQPDAMSRSPYAIMVQGLNGVVAEKVVAGNNFACVLGNRMGAAGVWCWGSNGVGALAMPGTTSRSGSAVQIPLGASPPVELVAGPLHLCARMTDNSIQCWGANFDNQCGTDVPIFRTDPIVPQ